MNKAIKQIFIGFAGWLFFFFTACERNSVIPVGKMQKLLYDLHKMEGVLQEKGYDVINDEEYNAYLAAVLRKYGVSQQTFDSSLVWYTAHPRRFEAIYPKIIEKLEQEKGAIPIEETEVIFLPEVQKNTSCQFNYVESVYHFLFAKKLKINYLPYSYERVCVSEQEWNYREKGCKNFYISK